MQSMEEMYLVFWKCNYVTYNIPYEGRQVYDNAIWITSSVYFLLRRDHFVRSYNPARSLYRPAFVVQAFATRWQTTLFLPQAYLIICFRKLSKNANRINIIKFYLISFLKLELDSEKSCIDLVCATRVEPIWKFMLQIFYYSYSYLFLLTVVHSLCIQ